MKNNNTVKRMDIIERMEAYKIMAEVFIEYVPADKKTEAMAQVAERIKYEIKDAQNEQE